MGDPSGKEIGIDIEVVVRTISKLHFDPDVVANSQLPEVGGQWSDSRYLAQLRATLSGTVANSRDMMTKTDQFSQAMAKQMSGAVDDLTATEHEAAERAAKLLQDLEDATPEADSSGQAEGSAQDGSAGAPGRTESDIAAIMRGDVPGSSNSGASGGTSRGGKF